MEQWQHNICISLTDNELSEFSKKIEEVFLSKNISLPSEQWEKICNIKNLIEILIKDTIINSNKYSIGSFIWGQLSIWSITRKTNIFSSIKSQEINNVDFYSFKDTSRNLIKTHWYQLYEDTGHKITITSNEKEKRKIILELLKDTKEEEIEIAYSEIQQDCYPIEIIKELWLELRDLSSYMIDISQAMKLIHTHKVHQRYWKKWNRFPNIFIVKWINDTPAIMRIWKWEKRRYTINPLNHENGKLIYPCVEIEKWAKFFLKIPSID